MITTDRKCGQWAYTQTKIHDMFQMLVLSASSDDCRKKEKT